MPHLVDRAQRIARLETRATPHAYAHELARAVVDRNETWIVKHLSILVAANAYVNVREDTNTETFVERLKSPVREWTRNLLRSHGTSGVTISAEHVEPTVQMM